MKWRSTEPKEHLPQKQPQVIAVFYSVKHFLKFFYNLVKYTFLYVKQKRRSTRSQERSGTNSVVSMETVKKLFKEEDFQLSNNL